MTTALIDADIVAYRNAASCQKKDQPIDPIEIALARVDEMMLRILHETSATSYNSFLTGSDNFRYKYNPEYKANRKDTPRPQHLQHLREHLVTTWNATVEDGQEADDAMGIFQSNNPDTVIASIDKDLLMIPGNHYNFVTGVSRAIDSTTAIHHFYWQLLMGDRTDNIFGFDGLARQKIPNKLQHIFDELESYDNELDMFDLVRSLYDDDERLLMNGISLWIRRKEGEIWEFPH